ncbi:hypothetical protein TRFO_38994 [Tritrichomonas foetus]|uniref:RING-type domain-containing protein n=1 Tax=Tritrichomonas foetus TaxID=1144522 RepID=A0A1J4J6E5_9EUKA|nr:hypothetical protein TRFO_38994 [Tritrichomonas foetus]|eukprot:OHS94810.1 hypothetical protein TRFO_38994 [Tritrichomonas foetus]
MSVSTCGICAEALATTGDHQICSLACGHLFGFKCINTFFETCPFCPQCKKEMKLNDIQLVFWTTSVESGDCQQLLEIEKNTKMILNNIENLEKNIKELECKLKRDKKILAKNITINKSTQISEFREISQPGMILNRKITDGFRIHTMQHIFMNTSKNENQYGIQFSKFSTLDEISFIPIHTSQIRDITSSGTNVITCSIDKSLCFSSIETQKVINRFNFSNSLWSCVKINENSFCVGGDRGFIASIDPRSGKEIFSKKISGPPVNSLAMLNENIVVGLTVKDLHFFDITKGDFVKYQKKINGGFSLRSCAGSNIFILLSRNESTATVSYCWIDQNHAFSAFSSFEIASFKHLIRPSIYCYDDAIYSAIPNEANGEFSLYALSQPKYDMWGHWRSRFQSIGSHLPVIDCIICEERNEFLIGALSSDRVRIFTVPPI